MIKNYFKTAFRNFQRDRSYALINIVGLGVALMIFFLTVAYIRYELAFDRHLSNVENLYRIVMVDQTPDSEKFSSHVPSPLGKTLRDVFPEIMGTTSFSPFPQEQIIFETADKSYPSAVLNVDENFFLLFDLPFVDGNLSTPLAPSELIITQQVANILFPAGDAIGQTLTRTLRNGKKSAATIRAVIEDIPEHTHFHGDILQARPNYAEEALNLRAFSAFPQYLMLQSGIDEQQFEEKINIYLRENFEMQDQKTIHLLPVKDIHLKSSHIENFAPRQHDIRFIYLFGFIALLILTMACINYINLSIARYLQKIKEMGVRKVMGASKFQLCTQVFAESLLLFGLSLPLSLGLAWLAWSPFSKLFDISDQSIYLINTSNLLIITLIALLTAFFASIYPAMVLLSRPTTQFFKQKPENPGLSFGPRKILIAFQFAITIVLTVATLVLHSQLKLLNNRSMGFEKEHLLVLNRIAAEGPALKQQLLQIPNISEVSFAGVEVGEGYGARSSMTDPNNPEVSWNFSFVDADFDFMKTMKLELIQGRYFDRSYGSDFVPFDSVFIKTEALVITETTAEKLGINSVDTTIALGALQGKIIGIIKDFRMTSFKEQGPMVVLRVTDQTAGTAYVRIASHDIPKTIASIENAWKSTFPNQVFDYHFVDEQIQQMYQKEDNLAQLFNLFSLLAIVISTLGLFSLVALMVKHRTKEIGIRKVVGASLWDISRLFTSDFFKLIFFSSLIALPIAWWIMNKWLEDYAYRIEISWQLLALAAVISITVTLLTVSLQAVRAGMANPVNSLRDE